MIHRLKLYCDMDGVLVNFDKKYDEITNGNRPDPADDDAFWAPILATPDFWLHLEWAPGGKELWEFVSRHHYVTILSSPGNHDTERAMRQKLQWIRREMGEHVNVVFKYSKMKHHYACNRSILIDDWSDNIDRWNDAGGIGIHHKNFDVEKTLARLEGLGLDYRKAS